MGNPKTDATLHRLKPHPKVEADHSKDPRALQVACKISRVLLVGAATKALEPRPRLVVQAIGEAFDRMLFVARRRQIAHEGLRTELHHLLPGRAPHGRVRGNEADAFAITVL